MGEHDDARVIIAAGASAQKTENARPQGDVVEGERHSLLREHSTCAITAPCSAQN
jgi:hypothetical protein